MPTLLLTKKDVSGLLVMKDIIRVVEQGFRDWTEGRGAMPPKAYLQVKDGDFRAMPAALPGAAGVKWVNVHTGNPAKSLPTVMALLIYSDPATGYPLSVMDATDLTAYRTGATAAIAARYLARKNARTLGLVGAGRQAYTQILAHVELFKFDEIRVYDVFPKAVERLIQLLPQYPLKPVSLVEAIQADIVCTVTPAREPVVKKDWVMPGTHINAVGADAEGKEELEPEVLKMATVIVDDLRQASKAGEINVPVAKGLYKPDEVYANLGEVITGRKKGRTGDTQVTVFDSTGVAIEDIAVARLVYERAREKDTGFNVNFVEG
jgi:alanine dehydrogenase